MLVIEDCLLALDSIVLNLAPNVSRLQLVISDKWDRTFISDVASYVKQNNAISTTQAEIVLKLIKRYEPLLEAYGIDKAALANLIIAPVYRKLPYQSLNIPREVRYLGDNKLAFRCKYNKSIVDDIKRLRQESTFESLHYPLYTPSKIWVVAVTYENLQSVMTIIKRYNFSYDDPVEQYFLNATNAIGQSSYVVVEDEDATIVVNDDELLNNWLKVVLD